MALLLYVVTLPVLWPRLLEGEAKTVVAADLAFLALVAAVAAAGPSALRAPRPPVLVAAALPLAGLAFGVVSGGFASARPDLLRLVYSVAVFALLAHLRLPERGSERAAAAWVLTAGVLSALGAAACLAVWLLGLPPNALARDDSGSLVGVARACATLDANVLSVYLGPSAALAGWLLAGGRGPRRLLLASLAAMLLVAPLTLSRGVAGAGLTVALLLRAARARGGRWARAWKPAAAAAAALLLAAAAFTAWAVIPLRAVREGGHPALTWNTQRTLYNVVHTAALRMVRDRPLFGVGAGRFGTALPTYATAEERQASWPPTADIDWDPHSTWLGWAAECGLPGLACFAGAWALIACELRRAARRAGPLSLPACTLCALAGVAVNGFHVELTHLKLLWAFAGLALAAEAEPEGP